MSLLSPDPVISRRSNEPPERTWWPHGAEKTLVKLSSPKIMDLLRPRVRYRRMKIPPIEPGNPHPIRTEIIEFSEIPVRHLVVMHKSARRPGRNRLRLEIRGPLELHSGTCWSSRRAKYGTVESQFTALPGQFVVGLHHLGKIRLSLGRNRRRQIVGEGFIRNEYIPVLRPAVAAVRKMPRRTSSFRTDPERFPLKPKTKRSGGYPSCRTPVDEPLLVGGSQPGEAGGTGTGNCN